MATAVIMPRQGQSVESCVIVKWHKQKGESVSIGDSLFTYETDKAVFELAAEAEGILLDIFHGEGDDVECLKTVCVIGSEGENIEEFRSDVKTEAVSQKAPSVQDVMETTGKPAADREASVPFMQEHVFVSPRARALAKRTGADVSRAVPTGANNRIIEDDIKKVIGQGSLTTRAAFGEFLRAQGTGIGGRVTTFDAMQSAIQDKVTVEAADRVEESTSYASGDFEEVRLSNIRKVIANTMYSSLHDSAQLTMHSSFDATVMLNYRKKLKAAEPDSQMASITITDLITFAVSRLLLKHKSINAHFLGDRIAYCRSAHIGVAVDTPRGLMVPTIFNADKLTPAEISVQAKTLFEKCKQGSIGPDALKGGTFTISNLGTLGIEMFTPILNPPQTGLLGVCSIVERTKGGLPYPAMGLSLTFDHRALDGADAARFLKDVVEYLENIEINIETEGKDH